MSASAALLLLLGGLLATTVRAAELSDENPDGQWRQVIRNFQSYPDRHAAAVIFDPVDRRLILFGGVSGAGYGYTDVWTRGVNDQSPWRSVYVNGTPPPSRSYGAAVYDSRRHRMLVVGGVTASDSLDTWALSLGEHMVWTNIVTGPPRLPRRNGMVAGYDSLRDRLVIATGVLPDSANATYGGLQSDVWALSLSATPPTWTRLDVQPPLMVPRTSACGALDPDGDRLLVFSGTAAYGGYATDLEAFPLGGDGKWSGVASIMPRGFHDRWNAGAAFDRARQRLIVYGGYYEGDLSCFCVPNSLGDVWEFDFPTHHWILPPCDGLTNPDRYTHSAAWDQATGSMWVVGGLSMFSRPATLRLDTSPSLHWNQLDGIPENRLRPTANVSPLNQKMVVFGGLEEKAGNDVWSVDLTKSKLPWRPETPYGSAPPGRYGHTSIYDSFRDRLVIFGGYNSDLPGSVLNDAWTLSLAGPMQWSPLLVPGGPAARWNHAAEYDDQGDRMIVFGGVTVTAFLNDLWQLSFAGTPVWSHLIAGGTPPSPREMMATVYDSRHRRILLFGGSDGTTTPPNDLWSLSLDDPPTWQQLSPPGPLPAPRFRATLVPDLDHGRAILFGGDGGADNIEDAKNDTWELTLASSPQWYRLAPSGSTPPRSQHAAIEDPESNRMLIFAGRVSLPTSDLWALERKSEDEEDDDNAVHERLSDGQVTTGPGRVKPTWTIPGGAGVIVSVLRRTEESPWSVVAHQSADEAGRVMFMDQTARPGVRYGYAIDEGRGLEAEVWGTAPPAEFDLSARMLNGTSGPLDVNFTLDTDRDAHLAIYDIGGRRVWERSWPLASAGAHSLQVAEVARMAPGVYALELRGASERLVRRFVVVR